MKDKMRKDEIFTIYYRNKTRKAKLYTVLQQVEAISKADEYWKILLIISSDFSSLIQ